MKRYIFLAICFVVCLTFVLQIPNISKLFARECSVASVVNADASESVSCKGIVEKSNEEFLVKAQISEEDISKVCVGMQAKVTCKALGDKVLLGRLKKIYDYAYKVNYGDFVVTAIDVVISFDKEYEELKQGYTALVDIVYTKVNNADILPFECVAQEKNGKYYVYKINKNWAVKQYVDVAFEDEKGAVLSQKYDFNTICEQPESFFGDYVRIKNVGAN